MTYRIRTVSEITGIPRNTLIAWERRYGAIRPERHVNGYRSYSEEDVAQLLRIKNALNAGLKISEAVSVILQRGASGADELEHSHALPPEGDAFVAVRERLLEAVLNYRREDAERVLARLMTVPFKVRLHEVYFPVLRRVGELWEQGSVSIAQEHYASSILRAHLASILVSIGPASTHAPHAVCTTFPGDLHEMAALALAIQLSLDGHRLSYLGANLPMEELRSFYLKERPRLLCVSVISSVDAERVRSYALGMSAALAPGDRLILGGSGLRGITLPEVRGVELVTEWPDDLG
jgi:DNA-binding transcriptional MerR regulator